MRWFMYAMCLVSRECASLLAHPSDRPYSKVLNESEWIDAVRKLANWCFNRFKCDKDYRCQSGEQCNQALDLLFKQLLS